MKRKVGLPIGKFVTRMTLLNRTFIMLHNFCESDFLIVSQKNYI